MADTTYSPQEIMNKVYDTVDNKIWVEPSNPHPSPSTQFSVQEILNNVYDSTNNLINIG